MPLILFTSWMIPFVEANPGRTELVSSLSVLLLLGFALLAAVFPFHVWLPMVSAETNPYAVAFIFFIVMGAVSTLGLTFLVRYEWLNTPVVLSALRLLGVSMVLIGGVWSAFEQHLGRIMGFAMILIIGVALIAVSLGASVGLAAQQGQPLTSLPPLISLLFALFIPTGICLAVWSLALTAIRSQAGDLRLPAVQGIAHRLPVASSGVVIANLAVAGLPLLAFFPIYIALWSALAQEALGVSLVALIGLAGLALASLRSAAVLVIEPANPSWHFSENRWPIVLLIIGLLLLLLIGVLPGINISILVSTAPF
jgi:formate hydrogenlyase subunit 3/multisubunit Na+/H+ antiporter MnhD subunit